jgi:tetratricopeptide (TPR) repeat protein
VPHGDYGALRLTAEVFLAQCGISVEVRSGGTLIGKQGSSLRTCLCLICFAPTRALPKRVRIDVLQEASHVKVQARFDDSFAFPKLNRLVARRYERQFSDWLKHLAQQVLPDDIIEEEEVEAVTATAERDHKTVLENGLTLAGTEPADRGSVGQDAARIAASEGSLLARDTPAERGEDLREKTLSRIADQTRSAGPLSETIPSTEMPPPTEVPVSDEAVTPHEDATEGAQTPKDQEVEVPEALDVFEAEQAVESEQSISPSRTTGEAQPDGQAEKTQRSGFRLPRLGLWKRAQKAAGAARTLPQRVSEELTRGDALFEAADWKQSVVHYDAAIAVLDGSQNLDASDTGTIAQIYFRRGMARFRWTQASFDSPREAGRSASDFEIVIESMREVIADYSESIRLKATQAEAFYRRGEAHLFTFRCQRGSKRFRRASQELNEASADFTRATELEPTLAAAYALRAIAHSLLERDEEVDTDINKAVELGLDPAAIQQALHASRTWAS